MSFVRQSLSYHIPRVIKNMLYFGFLIHAIFITSKCFFKMNWVFFASGFLLFSAEIFKMKVFGFFAARFLIFSFKIFNMINVKNMTITINLKSYYIFLGLRKSTLTVRPSMYTETKIITQEEDSKPRSQNHAKANRKKPKLSGDTKPSKSVKSKPPPKNPEPASEESPAPSPSKLLPQKYVLFVGNLPYSVTKEQLEEHFRKTGWSAVCHLKFTSRIFHSFQHVPP